MSQTTLLTREPVVNKNRAITANRLANEVRILERAQRLLH